MLILVACEESQVVTKAFRKRGHDAWSCDLQPCSGGKPEWHLQGSIWEHLFASYRAPVSSSLPCSATPWDLVIAFPPCTHLAVSGARWFKQKRRDGRQQTAVDFFMALTQFPCERIAIENPVGIMSTKYCKPDQIIQPWQFGHGEAKATCLWLTGLAPLEPTHNLVRPAWIPCPDCEEYWCQRHQTHASECACPNIDEWPEKYGPYSKRYDNQTPSGQNHLGPSDTRAQQRSKTYPGIARAMAEQWGRP